MAKDNRSGVCVTGKVRYANDNEASIALNRVRGARARRPDGNPPERQFYFCDECSGWHLSSKPPLLGPEPPPKHDGETWAEYARRLERRIKEQRDQLEAINALRADAGNRSERKRIEFLIHALGKLAERHERERTAKLALVERVHELEIRRCPYEHVVHHDRFGVWTMREEDETPRLAYPSADSGDETESVA